MNLFDIDRVYRAEKNALPLIHMVQEWNVIELILKQGFKPSYCTETLSNEKEEKEACFPMISMSNVSPDFAKNYLRSYGTFGIILKKEWGEKNDFNPVLYLEQKSDLTNTIIKNFSSLRKGYKDELYDMFKKNNEQDSFKTQHIKIFAHSKNYDGKLVRKGKLISDKYSYGLEREWRKIIRKEGVDYFIVNTDIKEKEKFNKKIEKIRVLFSIEDLEGIIYEYDWQKIRAENILKEKYRIKNIPKNIHFFKNTIREIPDEG